MAIYSITWNAKCPIFSGNFTPKTSNYCLKHWALGFPGNVYYAAIFDYLAIFSLDGNWTPQARATGKLKQLKSANSIVQAGELLGSLQLEEGIRVSIGYKNRLGLVDMEDNDVTFEFCFLLTHIYIYTYI